MIFFIPAFFYKSDIKHKQTEIELVASNHLLPGQEFVDTEKGVKWSIIIVFLVLFLLAFISVGLCSNTVSRRRIHGLDLR
jgi:hypothetical protein